jgi:hypothetical protein
MPPLTLSKFCPGDFFKLSNGDHFLYLETIKAGVGNAAYCFSFKSNLVVSLSLSTFCEHLDPREL